MTTLSLFEDNAGGLKILRHCDNVVFVGLEELYANGGSYEGSLLSEEAAEYWVGLDIDEARANGNEFRVEPEGIDAPCFERDGETPNGILLIGQFDGESWRTFGNLGENGKIATGLSA